MIKKLIERKEYLGKLLSYKDKDIIKVVTGFAIVAQLQNQHSKFSKL